MRLIPKMLLVLTLVVAFGCLVQAAEVQGVLLDKVCSVKIVKANDQAAAKQHTRDCALMEDCVKAGYGVLTAAGQFINIDPAGKAKVVKALKASQKKDDIRVLVSGEQKGDTIKIASIKIL